MTLIFVATQRSPWMTPPQFAKRLTKFVPLLMRPCPAHKRPEWHLAARQASQLKMQLNTSYLSLIAGPVTQKIDIAAHASETISLLPGDYDVAARVSNPTVIPFFGRHNYAMNTGYSEQFYLSTNRQ